MPLETRSGKPHLSNEQREHFEKNQLKCIDAIGYMNQGDLKKIFGLYGCDFDRWRVHDLLEPCIHPVHMNKLMAEQHLETMRDHRGLLEAWLSMKKITQEEYDDEILKINYQELLAVSEWNLHAKKSLREIKCKLDANNAKYIPSEN